jgi:hypothetical protein
MVNIPDEIREGLNEALRELAPGISDKKVNDVFAKLERVIEEVAKEQADKNAGYCTKCGHSWNDHDRELKGAGKAMRPEYNPNGYEDLYQCEHYMGMGDWCGCEERSRRPAVPEHLRR